MRAVFFVFIHICLLLFSANVVSESRLGELNKKQQAIVDRLTGSHPIERAYAAREVGSGEDGIFAVPYLIKLLDDTTLLQWSSSYGAPYPSGKLTCPACEAYMTLARIGDKRANP